MEREINLQKRDYVSNEKTYVQYRINIPIDYVVKLGWSKSQKLQMRFKKSKNKKFLQIEIED